MNISIKIVAVYGLIISVSLSAAVAVKELLEKQDKNVSLLQEYWIDKDGNTRVGDKDTTVLRFSFNKTLLDKMTDAQLRAAMEAALVKFTKEQQDTFKNMVTPQLDALRDINQQVVDMRKKMDDTAVELAKIIGKTQQDVMRLPDQNLKNIISVLTDQAKKISAYEKLTAFSRLRKEFAIEGTPTTEVAGASRKATTDQEEDTPKKTSTGQKIAQGIASTNFKISGMSGFVGDALKYGLCRSRHWDILLDSTGHRFISEAKP